jgi:hypothetical protein
VVHRGLSGWRTEYLLRRLVTKHAVAPVIGRPTDPGTLAGIEVRNAPSGAPYVCVDGAPLGVGVSITDRAGRAGRMPKSAAARDPRDGQSLRDRPGFSVVQIAPIVV